MKNRVEKLLKEKQKALSNIRLAKNRNVFIKKVNHLKEKDLNEKQSYKQMMREKLKEQRELIEKQRREIKENIQEVKKAKVEENRAKKIEEKQIKEMKKRVAEQHTSMQTQRVQNLKSSVISHRRQKSEKLETLGNVKNDLSQIRYHLKNEKLSSTRELHKQQIEELKQKEQELLEQLKHTLERQEKIENETNSPAKFRRAPSLTMEAKVGLFQKKLKDNSKLVKDKIDEKESF